MVEVTLVLKVGFVVLKKVQQGFCIFRKKKRNTRENKMYNSCGGLKIDFVTFFLCEIGKLDKGNKCNEIKSVLICQSSYSYKIRQEIEEIVYLLVLYLLVLINILVIFCFHFDKNSSFLIHVYFHVKRFYNMSVPCLNIHGFIFSIL